MFGLGPTELIVILVLALLVLGPSRIPEVAGSLGKAIRSFRRATRELRDQIDIEDEVRRPLEDLRAALRDEPQHLPPPISPIITPPPEAVASSASEPATGETPQLTAEPVLAIAALPGPPAVVAVAHPPTQSGSPTAGTEAPK
jgi:TatA/E family protein of Tat protein translocase